ncbi:MAG: AMP-binding protein [Gammaproteobacteria bacterium]|nr:AMP-binding protein [Gammaproteobacteria bacterium]
MSLVQYLDRGAVLNPQGEALIGPDRTYTYVEVQALTCRIAGRLRQLGFGEGSAGAVLSLNAALPFICTFGLSRAGMTWVPANPRNNLEENRYLLDTFDCRVLFFHSDFAASIEALRPRLPHLDVYVCLDRTIGDIPSLEEFLGDISEASFTPLWEPDAIACIMPTGGTTGASKGVQLTQRNIAVFVATYMACLNYRASEPIVNLAAAPLTHAAGLFTLATLSRGGRAVILPRAEPQLIIDAIQTHRVTELFLPPTVIYRMLDHPTVSERDYGSLRYFVYAAAPMSVEKLRRALTVFGPCMTQVFGQSEAPALCTFLAPEEHFVDGEIAPDEILSSCGHPTPFVQLRILDDDNREVPDGERGEICVRSDLVTAGYYKRPDLTAQTIIDGWLHTGDIGFRDPHGRIHICDRKKDMIISGGFNIYPQEIEQIIWSHPAVQDCAVIGTPDADWGEVVTAVVELNGGMQATAEEILALCRSRLGRIKVPKRLDFIASLPRSANGKVLKRELRETYWQGQSRRV